MMTVYFSNNNGQSWDAIWIHADSVVAHELGNLAYGSIYHDEYDHWYCLASLAS